MTLYPTNVRTSNGKFISPITCMGTMKLAAAHPFPQPKHAFVFPHIATTGTPIRHINTSSTNKVIIWLQLTLSATGLDLQARLRARWPAVLARARELEKANPNSIQSIVDLLGNLPGDYAAWREIIEEPYG